MNATPEQFKDDDAAYALANSYLDGLQHLSVDELITHLREQERAWKTMKDGPTGKLVLVIRTLIEAQGGNPDELLKIRKHEPNPT